MQAIRALARLYKRYQSWLKLIQVYETLIADARQRGDKEEEINFLMNLGAVYRDEVNEPESAAATFRKIWRSSRLIPRRCSRSNKSINNWAN